ncbi:MAG: hypothetical protein M3R57_11100 [Chloroflexota bacterium]|nr:hypothetical protein [Chloroflexota bacterium]
MRARVQEKVMVGTRQPAPRRRAMAPLLAGAAIAGFALVALVGPRLLAPGATPGGTPNPGSAACVEQYSLDTLKNRTFSFDGTVTGIAGDEVTFRVNEAFKGSSGESVTLTAAGMTGTAITSAGGPNLAVGERYLVAGEDHFAWACGFTQAYDAAVAAQWSAALDG